jgi:hypothetical protein
MDINTLKTLVKAALANSPFQISGLSLTSPPITQLFQNFFLADKLLLASASLKSESSTNIVIQGNLTAPFIGLSDLQVIATFQVVVASGGVDIAQVTLLFDTLPTDWQITTSFSAFKNSLLDAFSYSNSTLLLDSQDQALSPAGFPASFGYYDAYSSALKARLIAGMSIKTTFSSPSAGLNALKLFFPTTWSMSGKIALLEQQPTLASIYLASAPQTPFTIAGYQVPFALQLGGILFETTDPQIPVAPTSCIQLYALIEKSVTLNDQVSTTTLSIPVYFRTVSNNINSLSIDSNLSTVSTIGFEQITQLLNGQSIDGQIPATGFPALNNIQLQNLHLSYNTLALTAENISVTIGYRQETSLPAFNGLIVFNNLNVTFTYIPDIGVHTLVDCHATVSGGILAASITLPDLSFACELAEGSSIDIKALVTKIANSTIDMPAITCTQLKLFGDISTSDASLYRLQATITDDWTFFNGNFALTEIGMDMTYQTGTQSHVLSQIVGQFVVAGVSLFVVANYDSTIPGVDFQGGTLGEQNINLTALIQDVANKFNWQLPAYAPQFTLTNLNISFNTNTYDFSFLCTSSIEMLGTVLAIGVEVSNSKGPPIQKTFKGYLWLDDSNSSFEIDYLVKDQTQIITATWVVAAGETSGLTLSAILQKFQLPAIPKDLAWMDIEIEAAALTYDVTDKILVFTLDSSSIGKVVLVGFNTALATSSPILATGWNFFFGLTVARNFDLMDLPLVGRVLDQQNDLLIENIQAFYTSTAISNVQAQKINQFINVGYPQIPLVDAHHPFTGALLSMNLAINGQVTPLVLPMGASPTALTIRQSQQTAALYTTPSQTTPDGTVWFDIQKSIGPLNLQKIGIRYLDSKLGVLINTSMGLGGLTISLLGLGAESTITYFDPKFTLSGLGVSFDKDPIKVSGELQGTVDPPTFTGELQLALPNLTVAALGGYSEVVGHPSFFLYTVLNHALGGPAFFYVTGLAAGFGFNRKLVIPSVDNVAAFPLVRWAKGENPPAMDAGSAIAPQINTALTTLISSGAVAPAVGEEWLAFGVHFTSFELMDSFVLLTASFGNELEFDLLGLSSLSLPPAESADAPPPKPVVFAEVALQASFSPATGILAINGQLTPQSYVLSSDCHLTGGFAYYAWFTGAHAGDFVVTLGGYNPNFKLPVHYPPVARLALDWQIDSNTSAQGNLYFALTSTALMAGGGMSLVWDAGDIKAWFRVEADFLMVFLPFHYYIDASTELGASCRISLLFTHITITIHVGVGVEVWGPDFAGQATVDLSIISFTVGFGNSNRQTNTTIDWPTFVQQLLPSSTQPVFASQSLPHLAADDPASPDGLVKIQIVKGLLKKLSDKVGELNYVVNSEQLELLTQAAIPTKAFLFTGHIQLAPADQQPQNKGMPIVPNVAFTAGPVGISNADFCSVHALTLTFLTRSCGGQLDAINCFANVPCALWALKTFDDNGVPQVDPLNNTTLANVLTGYRLKPFTQPPDHTLPIQLVNLQYTIDEPTQIFSWSTPDFKTSDPFTDETVANTINARIAQANRLPLLAAMVNNNFAITENLDIAELTDVQKNYLLDKPMLRLLGEQK